MGLLRLIVFLLVTAALVNVSITTEAQIDAKEYTYDRFTRDCGRNLKPSPAIPQRAVMAIQSENELIDIKFSQKVFDEAIKSGDLCTGTKGHYILKDVEAIKNLVVDKYIAEQEKRQSGAPGINPQPPAPRR